MSWLLAHRAAHVGHRRRRHAGIRRGPGCAACGHCRPGSGYAEPRYRRQGRKGEGVTARLPDGNADRLFLSKADMPDRRPNRTGACGGLETDGGREPHPGPPGEARQLRQPQIGLIVSLPACLGSRNMVAGTRRHSNINVVKTKRFVATATVIPVIVIHDPSSSICVGRSLLQ